MKQCNCGCFGRETDCTFPKDINERINMRALQLETTNKLIKAELWRKKIMSSLLEKDSK